MILSRSGIDDRLTEHMQPRLVWSALFVPSAMFQRPVTSLHVPYTEYQRRHKMGAQ